MNFDDRKRRSHAGSKGVLRLKGRGASRPYESGVQHRAWLAKFIRGKATLSLHWLHSKLTGSCIGQRRGGKREKPVGRLPRREIPQGAFSKRRLFLSPA